MEQNNTTISVDKKIVLEYKLISARSGKTLKSLIEDVLKKNLEKTKK
jgi:hypothetical protein